MWIKSAISFESGDKIVSALCSRMAEKAGIDLNLYDETGGALHDHNDILQQSPSKLFSVTLRNRLKLLSPRIWWGLIDNESKKEFSPFFISTVIRSCVGLLFPLLIIAFFANIRRGKPATSVTSTRLMLIALISPWCIQCFYQLYDQITTLLVSFRTQMTSRSLTLARATDALKLRIRHRRAYRTSRYDVYLPPSLTSISEKKNGAYVDTQALRALFFIPGALVPHEAYSEVAARLSDKGFVVAVMSLEPLRLAGCHFGTNLASVKQIIDGVTGKIFDHLMNVPEGMDNELPIKSIEWTLIGHSMGAFAATQLFRESLYHPNEKTEKSESNWNITLGKKLVLWGVAAMLNSVTDLSAEGDAQILILQGTNDEFVEMMQSKEDELEAFFPPSTRTEHITGGTHEGFASYTSMFNNGTTKNNENTRKSIPLDRQHKQACDATVRFLSFG